MLASPAIIDTPAQLIAFIHLTVPRSQIRNVMGPGLGEVNAAIAAQGIAPAGPWLTHHLSTQPDIFDFEICVPVTTPVVAIGRVRAGELPAATVARTVFHGDYAGLGVAWGEFNAWIEAAGFAPRLDLWECYVVGPESSSVPADWRTQLNRPLMV